MLDGDDVQSTWHGLITYTIKVTHKITVSHLHTFSRTCSYAPSHTHFCLTHTHTHINSQFFAHTFWSETEGTTNSYHHLAASVPPGCSFITCGSTKPAVQPPMQPKNINRDHTGARPRPTFIVDLSAESFPTFSCLIQEDYSGIISISS